MPVSHITVTIVAPGRAVRRAAAPRSTLAPVEVPANRPSSRASRMRHGGGILGRDALDPVGDLRAATAARRSRRRCRRSCARPVRPPESTADSAGSTATMRDRPVMPAQAFGDAAQRRGGADALHEGVDPAVRLRPDLLGHRVIGGELVACCSAGRSRSRRSLRAITPRRLDHVARQFLGHAAALARHELKLARPGSACGRAFRCAKASEVTMCSG